VQQPRSGRLEGVTAGAGARVEGARDPRRVPAAAAPEDLGSRRAPDSPPEPGHSGSMLHVRGATGLARRHLLPWKGVKDLPAAACPPTATTGRDRQQSRPMTT
jgi:hypothetical protein